MKTTAYWKEYWDTQTTALHRSDLTNINRLFAAEIDILIAGVGANKKRTLEIGCGSGDLYAYLGFDSIDYTGIDLSHSLINIFRERYPSANIFVGDAKEIKLEREFSLVFANGVIQYFPPADLKHILRGYHSMLDEHGTILLSNILYKPMRKNYYLKKFEETDAGLKESIAALISPLKITNSEKTMGYWYETDLFKEIAEELDMQVHIFGSIFYPYRISVALTKR